MYDLTNVSVDNNIDIPFKEFTAGQVIQSKQFNDDMKDIEDKINEIIVKYNFVLNNYKAHIVNYENPHQVTAHQAGAYTIQEVDSYIDYLKKGNFEDGVIVNRVLADNCIETRNIKDGNITISKVEENFGNQLNISSNIDVVNRYTKLETDELVKSKVGDGAYSKIEIDEKLRQIQVGELVDKAITASKLKDDVGQLIDISINASIVDRYTKLEVNQLIEENGLPRDWGSITEDDVNKDTIVYGQIPVANVMTCGEFKSAISSVLDIDVAEVLEGRGIYASLPARLNLIESNLDAIIQMFSEVTING